MLRGFGKFIKINRIKKVYPNNYEDHIKNMNDINQKLLDNYKQYSGELSMGMSADYKIALDYGATIIRVGSKIFK